MPLAKLTFTTLAGILLPAVVQAQAPSLSWSTNPGATLFAVDLQTNAYANVGGKVIVISPAGQALQTNTICPLPGIARRDNAGNFYFAGSFDGTQDFGGITLLGGYTNSLGHWGGGWPSAYLAKYTSVGSLLWVVRFGANGSRNEVDDLLLDAGGACYAAYRRSGLAALARFGDLGTNAWEQAVGSIPGESVAITLGGLTATNCAFVVYDYFIYARGGRVDQAGNGSWLGTYPMRWRSQASINGRPVVDDLGRPVQVGTCFDPNNNDPPCSEQHLRKYGAGSSIVWSKVVIPEAHWTLQRDVEANVYLAGTNGMLAKFDNDGALIWSNNFSRQAVSMVVDGAGNRFLSFADGGVARLANEVPPQAPAILVDPQPQTVFVGDSVNFSVTAFGTQPLRYAWRLNGTNIAGATNSTYSFSSAASALSGNYTVLVTNVVNAVTSAPALVRVKSVQLYLGSQLLTNGTYVFASPPMLSVHSAFSGGSSFYTLDGSAPGFGSTFYSGPFSLTYSATVRALGYSADFLQSEAADTVNMIVMVPHRLAASSIGGGIVTTNLSATFEPTNCTSLPPDAVAWWRAEDNVQDAIGSHTSTAYGGLAYTSGLVGRAFEFNGANALVRSADSADLHFSNAMTLEAWVKPEGAGAIIAKWDSVQFRQQSSFRLRLGNFAKAYFAISQNGTGGGGTAESPPYCASVSAIPIGAWTYLAATYNGSSLCLYVNGVLEAQTPATGTIFPGVDDVAFGAMVGGEGAGGGSDLFKGLIDELALYRRALTAREILAIYQAGACGKNAIDNQPFTAGLFAATDSVAVKALPLPGYSFLYWLGDATGANPLINVSMERDKAVHAVFGTTLATTVAGGGSVQTAPSGPIHPYGSTVQLTAIPDAGNYFGFWGNAATGNSNPLYVTLTAPTQTVASIFGAIPGGQAALTVLVYGRGRVNLNPRANVYALNATVTLTAIPDNGQDFLNWGGNASGIQNPLSVATTTTKIITANFSTRPELRSTLPGVEGFGSHGFRFTLVGEPATAYQVLCSSNLTTWECLTWLTNNFGEVQFTDPSAMNYPHRFYKIAP